MFFTATNDNQHTDLQPVYVHDSGVEQPDLPDLGEQEEQNDEQMDVDGPDDDNVDDDYDDIYPSSPQEEYSREQETESDTDMSATEPDEAKDHRYIIRLA